MPTCGAVVCCWERSVGGGSDQLAGVGVHGQPLLRSAVEVEARVGVVVVARPRVVEVACAPPQAPQAHAWPCSSVIAAPQARHIDSHHDDTLAGLPRVY